VTGGGYGVLGCCAQWLANPRHNTTKNTSCGARCKEGPALTVEYIGYLKRTSWAGALRGWFQYYPGWHEDTGGHAVIAQSLPPGRNYMSPPLQVVALILAHINVKDLLVTLKIAGLCAN